MQQVWHQAVVPEPLLPHVQPTYAWTAVTFEKEPATMGSVAVFNANTAAAPAWWYGNLAGKFLVRWVAQQAHACRCGVHTSWPNAAQPCHDALLAPLLQITSDSGVSWTASTAPQGAALAPESVTAVVPGSATEAWAASWEDGAILHTVDAGQNWQKVEIPPAANNQLKYVAVGSDAQTVYVPYSAYDYWSPRYQTT